MQRLLPGKSALNHVQRVAVGEPFHRDNFGAIRLYRILRAAAHGASINQHRAGTANTVLAADMHAERLQFVAEEIAQQHAGLGLAGPALPVQHQRDRDALVGGMMDGRHCGRPPSCLALASASSNTCATSTLVSASRNSALAA